MRNYVNNLLLDALCASILLWAACAHTSITYAQDRVLHSQFDDRFGAITPIQLSADLASASNSTKDLYRLVERAGFRNESLNAYNDLKILANEQPNNPKILAAYCFAYKVASGEFDFNSHASAFGNIVSSDEVFECQTDLAKAATLEPRNWLVDIIMANDLLLYKGDRPAALALLRAAVAAAPDVSYVHSELAYCLCSASAAKTLTKNEEYTYPSESDYKEAVAEFNKAAQLQPLDAKAEWGLFLIYNYPIRDAEKAKEAKEAYLSELPPGYTLPAAEQQFLAAHQDENQHENQK